MRLNPDQLPGRLRQGLAPVHLVAGPEALLVNESADAIRAAAREQGFAEREVLDAGPGFDWNSLSDSARAPSLFATQRLLELRLPGGKPGNEGANAIRAWLDDPPEDTRLLVVAHEFDNAQARAKWVQAIEKAGVFVQIHPLDPDKLPRWIDGRMRARGLEPSMDAVRLLAERVEGNLLAAEQEIEKLALLEGPGPVDEATVLGAVADSARFQAFGMLDAALEGDAARALRALRGLRSEGVELVQVMGAVTWQVNQLARVAFAARRGGAASALKQARVWPKKRELMATALKRHRHATWEDFVARLGVIDRQIKGRAAGDPWQTAEQLLLALAGRSA